MVRLWHRHGDEGAPLKRLQADVHRNAGEVQGLSGEYQTKPCIADDDGACLLPHTGESGRASFLGFSSPGRYRSIGRGENGGPGGVGFANLVRAAWCVLCCSPQKDAAAARSSLLGILFRLFFNRRCDRCDQARKALGCCSAMALKHCGGQAFSQSMSLFGSPARAGKCLRH